MRAKDVLLTALQEFTGTVVFVSHDRYFIDKLATRIFEVEDGRVTVFPGNYEDYQWRKSGAGGQGPGAGAPAAAVVEAVSVAPARDGGSGKRLNPIKLRQMQERQGAIEIEVSKLEAEIADYEAALSNFVSVEETTRVNGLLEARRSDLEKLMSEWEELGQTIEANA
jgi:ATP-binding cassette, subfamily F, member 3